MPVPSPAGGMTDAQFTAVRDLRALLGNLQATLELVVRGGRSPDTRTVTEMRTMYAVLDKALTVLAADLKGTRKVRIERLVIDHVHGVLSTSVQGPLVSLGGPPDIDACKAMHQVCTTVDATLVDLARLTGVGAVAALFTSASPAYAAARAFESWTYLRDRLLLSKAATPSPVVLTPSASLTVDRRPR
ncbi:hypothetical protein [Yinghuangia seranimata]|uniref:hypothetical protein n=1 Tax=Yinghuangia seranimata TaxID=408067 RepID=UPI00248C6C82|nr:hypothetical protein [Yinghuangia seranimata]MDI2124978.1 hypothetical protein [Yinghuangia seranimata]